MRFPLSRLDAARHASLLALPSLSAPLLIAPLAQAYQTSSAALGASDIPLFFALLLTKRLALYSVAASSVALGALRSGDAAASLGTRVQNVTSDLLVPFISRNSTLLEQQNAPLIEALDGTSAGQQAAALPVVLAGFLLFSAFVSSTLSPDAPELTTSLSGARDAMSLSNAFVSLLLCNAEMQAICAAATGNAGCLESEDAAVGLVPLFAWFLALAAVAGAYFLPSSFAGCMQNCVNICIAIGVARVLQFPQLGSICAALIGLALYDAIGTSASVFAVDQLINTCEPSLSVVTTMPSDASPSTLALSDVSIMEQVARVRTGQAPGVGSWQPGLLTIMVNGRVTDALGLGDVVFPSILAGWAYRFDASNSPGTTSRDQVGRRQMKSRQLVTDEMSAVSDTSSRESSYFASTLQGYMIGCVLLEVAPVETTKAALVFLVPSMLISVIVHAATRNEISSIWGSNHLQREG